MPTLYILLLTLISNMGVTSTTATFTSQEACERAAAWHVSKINESNYHRNVNVIATCNRKG